MGKWFARLLIQEGFEVIITGRDQSRLAAVKNELGVRTAAGNIEAVRDADIILLSVDIDNFETVVKEIGPHVREGQIAVDVTSIKEFPVQVMQQYLRGVTVLGTHPLFGPGARDLANQNFVLTPADEAGAALSQKAKDYLEAGGARVTLMTPQEHDEMMAVVLGLAHFISIVAADTLAGIDKLAQMKAIGGSTYRVLTTLVESVISEDPELYATLQMRLPRMAELEKQFLVNVEGWAELVRNNDSRGFVAKMTDLKKKYAEKNVDFGQAYGNMYKIMEWL